MRESGIWKERDNRGFLETLGPTRFACPITGFSTVATLRKGVKSWKLPVVIMPYFSGVLPTVMGRPPVENSYPGSS